MAPATTCGSPNTIKTPGNAVTATGSPFTYPDGKIASYAFDARNRMQTVGASWTAGTTQYFYDDAGRLDYATLPATTGVTEDYGYDVADRVTSVTNTRAGPPTTLSFANYVLNPNGNRTQMTDTTGVTAYNYDVLDRLSSVTYPSAPTTTAYTYDGAGNRLTQQVDANPPTVNTYDEADQLKTIGGVTNGYDLNGSLLTIGSGGGLPDTFLYDQENRLFRTGPCRADVNGDGGVNSTDQLSMGGHFGNQGSTAYDLDLDANADLRINSTDQLLAASEFSKICKGPSGNGRSWYDGDGLRISQRTFTTAAPVIVTDDYVWDAGSALPVVLQDIHTPRGQASSTTTYLYGLGLISETSGTGVTSYYLADGLGSTTQLTDSVGAVTDSYSYDVFGAPRNTTGTTANNFQYTGQQRDGNANRGLYYLRARSYDPALGRFLSRDPLRFGNPYAYAGNDPVNLTDPTGLCPWGVPQRVCDAGSAAKSATVTVAKVVAPVAFQCAVWGGSGALLGGGLPGAAVGCATGVTSYLLQEYGPNNPYLQCAVWGVGGAAAAGSLVKAAAFGAGGCVGGLAGFFEDSSSVSQCLAWALGGAVAFAARPSLAPRLWGTLVGCGAGAVSTVYGAELSRHGAKE